MYVPQTIAELIDCEQEAGQPFGPFHQHWLKERAPQRVKRHLKMAREYPNLIGMAQQGFASHEFGTGATAAFTARNTSTAELNIMGADAAGVCPQAMVNQFSAIPANHATAGRIYLVKCGGIYGNTATPTLIITPRWGSSTTVATNVTLGASGTFTTITGTSALPYFIQFVFTIRTAPPGATLGTGYGTGYVKLGIPVTSSQFMTDLYIGGTAATIDTTGQGTAGCGLTMNATWSASSASNTSTLQWWSLQSLN